MGPSEYFTTNYFQMPQQQIGSGRYAQSSRKYSNIDILAKIERK